MEKPRKYQETWHILRSRAIKSLTDKDTLNKVRIQVSESGWRTVRKALQKEKWLDEPFKNHFPNSKLETEYKDGILTVTLNLYVALTDADFARGFD